MNLTEILVFLDGAGYHIVRNLISVLWQSSLIFLAAYIITSLLRRHNDSIRHYVWFCAMLAVPMIPVISAVMFSIDSPRTPIPVIPSYQPQSTNLNYDKVETSLTQEPLMVIKEDYSSIAAQPPEPIYTISTGEKKKLRLFYPWAYLTLLYTAGVMFFFTIIIYGRFNITKWMNTSRDIKDSKVIDIFRIACGKIDFNGTYLLRESKNVYTPLSFGVFWKTIILPENFADSVSPRDLYSVAMHEISHLKRNDPLIYTMVAVIRALFFFHPLIWYASKKIVELAEYSCDDNVLNFTRDPLSYAKMLAKIAGSLPESAVQTNLAAGAIFSKHTFLRRVEVILSDRSAVIRKLSLMAVTGILALSGISMIIALALPLGEVTTGEPVNVTGRVIYGAKPVKDAVLYLETYDKSNRIFKSVEKMGVSGRDGSFSFKIDSNKFQQHYRWAKPSIIALNPDYSVGWQRLNDPENTTDLTIKLTEKMTVSGIILDMRGNPIEGAEVFVKGLSINRREEKGNGIGSLDEIDNNLIFRSGKDGKFTISYLPVDSQILIRARAKGYAFEFQKGLVDAGTDDVRITLKPEGKITGKVFYSDSGKPAKDVYVLVSGWGSSDHVKTDGNGTYVIENLVAGKYMANVFIDSDFPEWTAEPFETVIVEEGETTRNIDFKLIKGGIVNGKITAADTGEPLQGQEVSARPSKDFLRIIYDTCKTDRNGVYRLRVPPGKAKIYTNSPVGFMKAEKFLLLDTSEGETLSNSDFSFERGVSIQVAALSPEGVPVGGTSMVDKNTTNIYDHLVSDKNGVCVFNGLTPEETLTVYAENSRYKLKGEGEIKIANGAKLEIRMKKYKTNGVGGHVLDQDGNPVKGARLKLIDWKTHISITEFVSKTDADGKYDVNDLIMGNNYNLSVEADGYEAHIIPLHKLFPEERSDSQPNPLKPDKPVYNVILYKADRWIDAEIVDEDGNPVQGAQVQNSNRTVNMQVLLSDQNGHFRMDKMVPVVENEITISHKDFGTYTFRLIPTNTKQKFVLHKSLTKLTGILVDKNNKPIPGADINIDKERSESGFVYVWGNKTDAEGKFLINQVADKEVDIIVTHENFGLKMFHVKTTEGPVTLVFDKPDERKRQEIEFDSRKPVFLDGQKAPEPDVAKWLNGSPVKLKDLKGKIVVLGFWTSDEMPWIRAQKALNILAGEYTSKGVVFIEIHENTDDIPQIDKVIKDLGLTYRIAVDKKGTYAESGGKTFDRYGVYKQPDRKELLYHTIIDKQGIAHQNVSLYSLDETIKEFIRGGK